MDIKKDETVGVAYARTNLEKFLADLEKKEKLVILKNSTPLYVAVSIENYEKIEKTLKKVEFAKDNR